MWRSKEDAIGPILRKFYLSSRTLGTMQSSVVWEVLQGNGRALLSDRFTRKRQRSGVEEEDEDRF